MTDIRVAAFIAIHNETFEAFKRRWHEERKKGGSDQWVSVWAPVVKLLNRELKLSLNPSHHPEDEKSAWWRHEVHNWVRNQKEEV